MEVDRLDQPTIVCHRTSIGDYLHEAKDYRSATTCEATSLRLERNRSVHYRLHVVRHTNCMGWWHVSVVFIQNYCSPYTRVDSVDRISPLRKNACGANSTIPNVQRPHRIPHIACSLSARRCKLQYHSVHPIVLPGCIPQRAFTSSCLDFASLLSGYCHSSCVCSRSRDHAQV